MEAQPLVPARGKLGKIRNPVLMALLFVVSFSIYWLVWLSRVYLEMKKRSPGVTKTNHNLAALLMLVPLFNIYWIVHIALDFPRTIRRLQESDPPIGKPLNTDLLTALLLMPFALSIFFLIVAPQAYLGVAWAQLPGMLVAQSALNSHWRAHQASGAPVQLAVPIPGSIPPPSAAN